MEVVSDLVSVFSTIAAIAAGVAGLMMALAYRYRHWQDTMVYHPQTPENSTTMCATPSDFGISHYEVVHIQTSDKVKIRGYFMRPGDGEPSFTLVYFHGNAGNVGHRLPIAKMLMHHLKCSVLMMDYRGYGLSDPVMPTEEGLKLDAQATLDYAATHPKVHKDKIFVLGTSLGGAVTIDLASKQHQSKRIAGVMLENTFTSISDMADALFSPMIERSFPRGSVVLTPFLKYVVKPIVLFVGWWSIDVVRKVSCPILFLSGSKDELVPPSHVKALHSVAAASGRSSHIQLVEFPQGKHNDTFTMKGYPHAIEQFVKDVLRKQQQCTEVV